MTWKELSKLEPRLKNFERQIKQIKDDKRNSSFCANRVWGEYKYTLRSLVGYWADTDIPELKTNEAYDIARQHLYDLLPNCRNCGCM